MQVRPPGAASRGLRRRPLARRSTATCWPTPTPAGIRVVRWTTGEQIARLDGPYDAPALDWPLLAFRVQDPDGAEFASRSPTSPPASAARIAGARPDADLGRPALRGGLIAWHVATGRRSQVRLRPVAAGPQRSKRDRLLAHRRWS